MIIFGIFFSLIVVELGLRIVGWGWSAHDNFRNKSYLVETDSDTIRILCLGACYTAGVGVEPDKTYPHYLEKFLSEHYPTKSFRVINRGVRGKTLSFFVNRLERFVKDYSPRIIIMNIGSSVDFYEKNVLLANSNLLSSVDKIKISLRIFLKKFKIYRVFNLMFSSLNRRNAEINDKEDISREFYAEGEENKYHAQVRELQCKVKVDPQSSENWSRLAFIYADQGLYQLSEKYIKKAIELDQNNGWNYLHLFWCYVFQREYELAVRSQKQALDVDPAIIKWLDDEIKNINGFIKRKPYVMSYYFHLSDRYAMLGDYERAIKTLKQILYKGPDHIDYVDRLSFYETVVRKTKNSDEICVNSSVGRKKYFNRENSQHWAFMAEAEGFLKEKIPVNDSEKLDGCKIFDRLFKYNLRKINKIARKYNIKFFLENMGSSFEQQEIVESACKESNIPLVDLYSYFRNTSDDASLFHSSVSLRLSEKGNKIVAEKIFKALVSAGVVDEVN